MVAYCESTTESEEVLATPRGGSYLGLVVSQAWIHPNPSKIVRVIEHPTPTDIPRVRQFLGLASYYRQFIKGVSKIAAPLGRELDHTPCQHVIHHLRYTLKGNCLTGCFIGG